MSDVLLDALVVIGRGTAIERYIMPNKLGWLVGR